MDPKSLAIVLDTVFVAELGDKTQHVLQRDAAVAKLDGLI